MADEKPPAPQVPVAPPRIEGMESTPEIVIDGYQGVLVGNGMVKLNLFSEMADSNGGPIRRIGAGRLVISIANLVGFNQSIGQLLNELEQNGLLVRTHTPPDTKQ